MTGGNQTSGQKAWKGTISVGCMILAEATGETEEVILELTHKLERMSQRLMHQLSQSTPPPDEGDPTSSKS